MKKPQYNPTGKELEILRVLWDKGPSTVRAINDELSKNAQVGYTTTLKIMQIMFEKDVLSREKSGKTHIYQPQVSQEKTQGNLINKLLDTAFNGSAMSMVMQALGNSKSTKQELNEIRAYLDQLENKSDELD